MASMLDRIRKVLVSGESVPPNTSREISPPHRPSSLYEQFAAAQGRTAVIRECREMYQTDPRAKAALTALARDVVNSGFGITVTEGPRAEEAQQIAIDTIRRLRLERELARWIRMTAKEGDTYLELGISRDAEIVEITRKPTLQMVRLSDEFDRFPDPLQAFAWGDTMTIAVGRVPDDAVVFPQFLIVHARWDHDTNSRYGSPEFESALGAWKRVREGERDVAVRRKTRAGVRYQHSLIGASLEEVEAYKEANRDVLDAPFAAVADYFNNFDGGIKVIEGDARLGEMGDIEHHLQTWSAASSVPLELLAYGASLNRDVLGDKREQYAETLAQIREWAADELILPIIERQWLLAGILPESYTYSVNWPQKDTMTPEQWKALAEATQAMLFSGWSWEAIWAAVSRYLPPTMTLEALRGELPATPAPDADPADDDAADIEATAEAMRLAHRDTTDAVNALVTRLGEAFGV
jgi:hypothetical protein